ncbi:hypothetical protein AKJ09_05673 [Labilithrix luteola]|uniref:Uncharacterized protein n=1 Tax=Labilithrix luteola TaxID=1391654 RepID=A0A0K1Q0R9_9BACT|nr:hypothetical protein [Labilithrix luteola]AKU99009.1 hypothetical protein AKJ09_05673 [Labilithrix luteola]
MERLINELTQRAGLDRPTAEKVVAYLKDNVTRIPEMLRGDGKDKSHGDFRRR